MPSAKSNKKSNSSSKKSASKPFSSSFSSQASSAADPTAANINGEISSQEELSHALQEASSRFPSLISQTALVGHVSEAEAAAAANSSNGGCKIWMSESAMLASNITPGSIVSVSLASSSKFSASFPLSSLAFECANHFGLDLAEDLTYEAGIYFTLATVFPSCKVSKNAVRLSSNLSYTMGFPISGRTVFVYPLRTQSLAGSVNGNNKLHGATTSYFPLPESKELCLSLVTSKGKFIKNSIKSSHVDFSADTNAVPQSDNSVISSPKTPLLSQSKLGSFNSGQLSTPGFKGSMTDPPDLYGPSSNGLAVRDVLEDDSSKKLLQTCISSWLFSRNLLSGNLVIIPILSSLLVFQVTDASKFAANGRNLAYENSQEYFPYTVGHGTKVLINSLDNHGQQIPNGRILPQTELEHGNIRANLGIDSSKLGGLSKEFTVLKDIIVSSTVKGTLASMGLRPTKGVLIHGPPGTGKTSLARSCVHDAGVNLFSVNGPEIVRQYYGESEQALHDVFDAASRAPPAVVFIDELDAIAPARKDGGEELSQRMVATLLNSMDGISRTDGLLVIAATNRPDSIEAALRRPGRLDREIEIGVPSPAQRYEILLAILSDMEHTLSEMDIQHLATATHGFVGADLAALCNEAALVCLRRYVESEVCALLDCQPSSISSGCHGDVMGSSLCLGASNGLSVKDHLEDASSSILELSASLDVPSGVTVDKTFKVEKNRLQVAFEHFEKARMRVRPSAMREVILEVPKVSWEDVGGQWEVKMQLMEAVEWPQKHQDAFRRIGTRPPTGVLMFGPPGCSKTLLARAVASESGLNFLAVKGPELFSKWVGESEKAVRSLFAKARANAPSIIFFDEIDGLAVTRGKESDGVSVADRVMSQLLVELDGLHQRVNVTVIAATNRPDKIDPALLRPGRFDRLLYVGPPNEKDREDIFHVHLRKIPCSSDVCIKELALLTEGFTGADISLVCREAAMTAIEESLDASEIAMEHLKVGIKQVQPSELQSYQKLSTKFQRLVQSTAKEDDRTSEVHPSRSSHTPLWTNLNSIAQFLWRFPASLLDSESSSIG